MANDIVSDMARAMRSVSVMNHGVYHGLREAVLNPAHGQSGTIDS